MDEETPTIVHAAPEGPETTADSDDSSEDPRERASVQIAEETDGLVEHLDSLQSTLPLLMIISAGMLEHEKEEIQKYEEDHALSVNETKESRTVTLTPATFTPYKRLSRRFDKANRATILLPEAFVVALVSQYDAFLGGVVRALLMGRSEIVNATDRSIPFAKLVEFDSIAAARTAIINEDVEALLRRSHSEQFSWLESRFNLELRKELQEWTDFIELTERRNLFVHARGVVSRQYLDVCRKHRVKFEPEPATGDTLPVTPKYFVRAHRCVLAIGVMLGHVLWRKVLPDCRQQADKHLNSVCYELLVEGRYELAARLLDSAATTIKTFASEELRRMMVVNQAQAYKWRGMGEKCVEIMKDEDWSASEDRFKLADFVLRDDVQASVRIMKRMGATHDAVSKQSYRDWPLFREIRKAEKFRTTYREVFGEPLEQVEVEVKAGQTAHEEWQEKPTQPGSDDGDSSNGAVH